MDKRSVPSSGLDRSSNVDLSSILKDLINEGLIAQSDAAEIAGARCNRNAALLHP